MMYSRLFLTRINNNIKLPRSSMRFLVTLPAKEEPLLQVLIQEMAAVQDFNKSTTEENTMQVLGQVQDPTVLS